MNKELRKMELEFEVYKIDHILNILRPMVVFFAIFNLALITILIYVNIDVRWKIGLTTTLLLMSVLLSIAQQKCK